MIPRWCKILALIGVVYFMAEPAYGDHPGEARNDVLTERYLDMAWYYWQRTPRPADQCSHVTVVDREPKGADPRAAAWASLPGCNIWVHRSILPTDRGTRAQYCAYLHHEVGHNLGKVHDPQPGTLMHYRAGYIPPGCWEPRCAWHSHRHVHRKRIRGKVRKRVHFHQHCHRKVGMP